MDFHKTILQRGCSSVGRAPALQAGCQEFESPHLQLSRPDGWLGLAGLTEEGLGIDRGRMGIIFPKGLAFESNLQLSFLLTCSRAALLGAAESSAAPAQAEKGDR